MYLKNILKSIFSSVNTAFILLMLLISYIFFKRFIFPDMSYDSLNYHISLGNKILNSYNLFVPFKNGEFFPLGMHSFNPIIDGLSAFLYQSIGYRYGTLLSLLSSIGSIWILFRLIVNYKISISFWVVPLIISASIVNEMIFQLATYYTDNIYSFCVMVTVYLLFITVRSVQNNNISENKFLLNSFVIGVFLSLLSTKLTNSIYVLPGVISLFWLVFFKSNLKLKGKIFCIILAFLPFAIFVLPNLFFVYHYTGNPIFPYYNSIFKSIYYPQSSWSFNFGPKDIWERLFYPLFILKSPYKLGEVKDIFPDLKMFFYLFFFLCSLVFLYVKKIKLPLVSKWFFIFVLFCYFLWQFVFGYSRYAIALEMLMGLCCIISVNMILYNFRNIKYKILIFFAGVLFFVQSINIVCFNLNKDISWRPDVNIKTAYYIFRTTDMFQEYTQVNDSIEKKLKDVDFVFQCVNPSSGFIETFKSLRNKPVMNFDVGSNGSMTTNENFITQRNSYLYRYLDKKNGAQLKFVIAYAGSGEWNSDKMCNSLLSRVGEYGGKVSVTEQNIVDNFVGDNSKKIKLVFGLYSPK